MASSRDRKVYHQGGISLNVPPLSSTFSEVLKLYRADEDDVDRLVRLVERDASTSAYVLRRVNAAYFGLRREVSEIERAIPLLGFRPVCNLVLSFALKHTFDPLANERVASVYNYIMKTSVATAAYGRSLAQHLEKPLAETVFTGGLVHQLGRLIMLFSVPGRYLPLWEDDDGEDITAPLAGHERAAFRTDYTQVGRYVAEKWNLSKTMQRVIRYHRQPDKLSDDTLRRLALFVGAVQHAAFELYDPRVDLASEFYGLSPLLSKLARTYDRAPRALIDVLHDEQVQVRELADSILSIDG